MPNLTLAQIAEKLVENKLKKKHLAEMEEKLKEENKGLIKTAMEMMEAEDISEYVCESGKIKRRDNISGKIKNALDFFFWLTEKQEASIAKVQISPTAITEDQLDALKTLQDMASETEDEVEKEAILSEVKLSIHHKTLSGYLKNSCDPLDQKTWPDGVDVNFWNDLNVTVKK